MRGWQALTGTWKRPIQPGPIPERKAGRKLLMSKADRIEIFELDALMLSTRSELELRTKALREKIDAVFARAGLNREQSGHQLRSIRIKKG